MAQILELSDKKFQITMISRLRGPMKKVGNM